MKLYINYTKPHTHFLDITLEIDHIVGESIELQLAAWRPGRYELQNYAKNIRDFNITDSDNKPVKFQKLDRNRWLVFTPHISNIKVTYQYFANKLDAGGSWLDEYQMYLNPINFCLSVKGRENEAYQITLKLREGEEAVSSMRQLEPNIFYTPNYEELVDSPIIVSQNLQKNSYQVKNTTFHVVFQGKYTPDWKQIIKDFTAFTTAQINLFGEFPHKEYYFLCQILPTPFYHGVEHHKSTVLVLGKDNNKNIDDIEAKWKESVFYNTLLGIASHELFHAWNVKAIRPAEMYPYDYTTENYFYTGFVAEGVTTYYGDLMMARAEILSGEEFISEINDNLKCHFENFGRFYSSLADSSFDLWVDGYTQGAPYRKVSIYTEGALIALILDLTIRIETNHQKSLDDVMRVLYHDYAKQNKGYTLSDYQDIITEIVGKDMSAYVEKYVFGKNDLYASLQPLLNKIGCSLEQVENDAVSEVYFGFRFEEQNGKYIVTSIQPNSPAEAILALGDEIKEVNNCQASQAIDAWLEPLEENHITLLRNQQTIERTLKSDDNRYFINYTMNLSSEFVENQKYFWQWISGKQLANDKPSK